MTVPVVESYSVKSTSSDTTSLSIDKPTGTAEGDLLVIHGALYIASDPTVVPPAGWTQVVDVLYTGQFWTYTLYKVAGDSEPSSYTISWTGNAKYCTGCARISGVNTTTPVNASSYESTGSSTSQTCPSVTTSVNDCLVLRIATKWRYEDFTEPASHTEIFQEDCGGYAGAPSVAIAYASQESAGSTGTADFTTASSAGYITSTMAIAPTAGGSDVTVNPSPVSLALGVVAPAVSLWMAAAPVALSLSVPTPTIVGQAVTVTPDPVALSLSVIEPTVRNVLNPSPVALALSVPTPTVVGGTVAVPHRKNTWVANQRPTTWVANARPNTWIGKP